MLELPGFRLFVEVVVLVVVFGLVLLLVLVVLVDFGVVESEVVSLIGVVACVVVEEGSVTRNTVTITYIN